MTRRSHHSILTVPALALVLGAVHGGLNSPLFAPTLPDVTYGVSEGRVAKATPAPATPLASEKVLDRHDAPDRNESRARLRDGAAGTYIREILLARDSSLSRWRLRATPLRVWIRPKSAIADFDPQLVTQVRSAFTQWDSVGMGVHFVFVPDSARADIHVTWIDRFREPISGRTRWARDEGWWIVDASITLAVHHHKGETLDPESMRAMALHEVGHLLGLDHTTDASNIMTPRVRVRALSEADAATARLLYTLAPGTVR